MQLATGLSAARNNLNALRLVAAAAVLVSHAYVLTGARADPLEKLTGLSLGLLAVSCFFVVSGLLIARSFDRDPRLGRYAAARCLRLLPGLAVVLILTVCVLGPAMTTATPSGYWGAVATWTYIPRNITLASLQFPLTGMFPNNPFGPAVNGSLWTLPYEALGYVMVPCVAAAGLLGNRRWGLLLLAAGFGLLVVGLDVWPALDAAPVRVRNAIVCLFPFLLGAAAYAYRERLTITPLGLAMIVTLTVAAAVVAAPAYQAAAVVATGYAALLVAFSPQLRVPTLPRRIDPSYGMYIYAFPVQQTVVAVFPGKGALFNIALAVPVTLACGLLSWLLIEKRAIDCGRAVARRTPDPTSAPESNSLKHEALAVTVEPNIAGGRSTLSDPPQRMP